jgi:hypothetical protein
MATFLDARADKLGDVVKTDARQKLSDAISALDSHAFDPDGRPPRLRWRHK